MQIFASLPLQCAHLLQQKIANNYTKVKKILEVSVQVYIFLLPFISRETVSTYQVRKLIDMLFLHM